MTTATDLAVPAVLDAAELAVEHLPGEGAWTWQPADGISAAAGGTDWQAVQLDFADGSRLVLVVDARLARTVQVGPPPAEDLVDGLTPAVGAAVGVLLPALGTDAEGQALVDQELRQATAAVAADEVADVVLLLDDGAHRASLVLVSARPAPAEAAGAEVHEFTDLPVARRSGTPSALSLLHEVEMGVTVELGRTRMQVWEILELVPGSVIELDRTAGSPVDVLVNGTLVARGEVVVVDEEFGVRITEVLGHEDRDEA